MGNGALDANSEWSKIKAATKLIVNAPEALANDGDPDGDPLTAVITHRPKQGKLVLNANGASKSVLQNRLRAILMPLTPVEVREAW